MRLRLSSLLSGVVLQRNPEDPLCRRNGALLFGNHGQEVILSGEGSIKAS